MAQATVKRSTLGWIVALILVVLLLATGAGWYLGSRGSDSDAATTPKVGETAGPGEGDSDSICGLPNGDQSVPKDGPQATWRVEGHMTVPSSDEFGPAKEEGDDRSCFAHNPTGALFSLLNIQGMPPAVKVKHIAEETDESDMEAPPKKGSPTLTVKGFKIREASKDRVELTVAYSIDGETFTMIPATMVWKNGDWKLSPLLTEQSGETVEDLTSLEGYTKWGPK